MSFLVCLVWLALVVSCTTPGRMQPSKASPSPVVPPRSFTDVDLFGIQILRNSMAAEQLQNEIKMTLSKKFRQSSLEGYSGNLCVNMGSTPYTLSWECSEMHGCDLKFIQVEDLNATPLDDCFRVHLSEKELYPLSDHFPELRLGQTNPAKIFSLFGSPTFSNGSLVVYVRNRDLRGERFCGFETGKGNFRGKQVLFYFRSDRLIGIGVVDNLAEC